MSVLYAKVMALINRRRGNIMVGDRLSVEGITLELLSRTVFAGNREVAVTPKEYALLLRLRSCPLDDLGVLHHYCNGPELQ